MWQREFIIKVHAVAAETARLDRSEWTARLQNPPEKAPWGPTTQTTTASTNKHKAIVLKPRRQRQPHHGQAPTAEPSHQQMKQHRQMTRPKHTAIPEEQSKTT